MKDLTIKEQFIRDELLRSQPANAFNAAISKLRIKSPYFKSGITPAKNEADLVNSPPHYVSETGLEVIDVIEAFVFDLKGIEASDTANIIKYACRWHKKNGIEDIEKIIWYANHLRDYLIRKEEFENE